MTEQELAELRAYEPAEAARMLNIPLTRLERWVREDRIPHARAGIPRGVEFSAEDIRQVGRMRSELRGGRRGGHPTGAPGVPQTAAAGPVPSRRQRRSPAGHS
jgi:excisionase family DNA binding protein